jgi:predicted ATPase
MFRQLSVFAGGFTLQAAEAICDYGSTENIEVLDLITSLVDKSLLVSKLHTNRELRFRMLGVVREYAGDFLETSGNAEEMHERHAIYFLALANPICIWTV